MSNTATEEITFKCQSSVSCVHVSRNRTNLVNVAPIRLTDRHAQVKESTRKRGKTHAKRKHSKAFGIKKGKEQGKLANTREEMLSKFSCRRHGKTDSSSRWKWSSKGVLSSSRGAKQQDRWPPLSNFKPSDGSSTQSTSEHKDTNHVCIWQRAPLKLQVVQLA